MANFMFNIAKGRAVEFFYRVKNNDPTNSAIVVVPLSASGSETDLQAIDTLALVLAAAPNEAGASWGRKALTDADLAAPAPDDANNRFACTVPAITWTTPTQGESTTGVLVCYDSDTTGGTDANIIPICHSDFVTAPSGTKDVIFNAGDCLWAR